MALYRKTQQRVSVPSGMQILWGDLRGTRRTILDVSHEANGVKDWIDAHPSKDLHERNKITSGDWILTTHRSLTERQYVEISQGTATLNSGALTMNDTELIEE